MPIYIDPHFDPSPCGRPITRSGAGCGSRAEFAAWGRHSETAIHVLRMVLAGTLDRHPRLRFVIATWAKCCGDAARIDEVPYSTSSTERPISRAIFDQVWLTTSGIFSEPPFLAALRTFASTASRLVDYPYRPTQRRVTFSIALLAPADMAKLTHSNADGLPKSKVGA